MKFYSFEDNPQPEELLSGVMQYLALWGPRIQTAIATAGGSPSSTLMDFQSDLAYAVAYLERRRRMADRSPFTDDPFTWDDSDLPMEGQINE